MTWFVDAYTFLAKGGPVMIPLVACSIVSLAVMAERLLILRNAGAGMTGLVEEIEKLLRRGEPDQALRVCETQNSPAAAVLLAGLQERKHSSESVERAMTEAAARELPKLHTRMHLLDTIVTIAPLLGLLGTVTGMIRSFHVISTKEGMSAPTAITGGVAEALIATAAGLAIAIFTLVGYNYLNEKVSRIVSSVEESSNHLLRVLADLKEEKDEITALRA